MKHLAKVASRVDRVAQHPLEVKDKERLPEEHTQLAGESLAQLRRKGNQMAELVMNMGVGSAMWDAQVSETVGFASNVFVSASRFSDAFNLGIKKVNLAHKLNKYSCFLSTMIDKMYAAGENPKAAYSGTATTKDELESALRSLEYLYELNRRICKKCEASQLTNNSMMAGSLRTISCRSEQLLDVIDWMKCYLESAPSDLDALFSDARTKLESGDVYDLAELR